VEQAALFERGASIDPGGSPPSRTYRYDAGNATGQVLLVRDRVVRLFRCPADPSWPGDGQPLPGWAAGNYAMNFQVFGVPGLDFSFTNGGRADGSARIPASFPDGTAQTVLFTEK